MKFSFVFFWVKSLLLWIFWISEKVCARVRVFSMSPSLSSTRSQHSYSELTHLAVFVCVCSENSRIQTENIITSDGTRFGWAVRAIHPQYRGWIAYAEYTMYSLLVFVCERASVRITYYKAYVYT